MKKRNNKLNSKIIISNKRARYEFFIIKEIEAGIALQGWEVKSLRTGNIDITNSYVAIKDGEAFLLDAYLTPLNIVSSHYICNPMRIRKLLLNQYEIEFLYSSIKHDNYTIIPLSIFWKGSWCKVQIGIAKGKKQHDKLNSLKNREWQRYKMRILKREH